MPPVGRRHDKNSRPEKQKRPELSGRTFLQKEVYTDFQFFVKEIFNFFYFFLNSFIFGSIVAQFPSQFVLARPGLAPAPAQIKEDTCRII